MPRLAVDADVELSYTDTGTGRPVVFVHGGHMTHAVWRHQVAALAPEYRAITVDLRGHGDSDKPYGEYSVRTFAHDIATVFEELGLENGVVVGWSLGAQVVADFVAREPGVVDGAVFVSSILFDRVHPDSEATLDVDGLIDHQRTNQPEAMREFVSESLGDRVGEATRQWVWNLAMNTPVYVGVNHLRSLESLRYDQMAARLREVEVPALVVHGANDDVTSEAGAEYFATDVLDGRSVTFEHSEHFPFLAEPTAFNKTLREFLDEL